MLCVEIFDETPAVQVLRMLNEPLNTIWFKNYGRIRFNEIFIQERKVGALMASETEQTE